MLMLQPSYQRLEDKLAGYQNPSFVFWRCLERELSEWFREVGYSQNEGGHICGQIRYFFTMRIGQIAL